MVVNFIGFRFVDFVNDEKQHVEGVNAWYLPASANTPTALGVVPEKKWFGPEYISLFRSSGVGKYEIQLNLRGRVDSIKFIG